MELVSQRRLGFVLGLILGLGFLISSNWINVYLLPDIPLASQEIGTFWLIALPAILCGALGVLATWTEEALPSIILSALVASVASSLWIFITEENNRVGTFIILFLIFLPRMFFYFPFTWMVRWLTDQLKPRVYDTPTAPVWKVIPVILCLTASILAGTFSRYSAEEQQAFTRMQELVQAGLQASSRDELPQSLQNVAGFIERAEGSYQFKLGSNPDVLPVQRPFVAYGEPEPFIIIQFENGFRFGCVYSPPYETPACVDF